MLKIFNRFRKEKGTGETVWDRFTTTGVVMLQILTQRDKLERQEIESGLGVYPQDTKTHIHIHRRLKIES